MDKPPAKPPKTGNSLLQLLTRRSTKVEPAAQPPNTTASTVAVNPATASTSHPRPLLVGNGSAGVRQHNSTSSAHASPINQFRQSYVRRHSSTQNLSTIIRDEANSPLRKPANGGIVKKSKPLNNRFSHQFTLCCSFHDDRIYTPPVSVRYNSLAQNGGALLSERPAAASTPDAGIGVPTNTATVSPVFSGGSANSADGNGTSASTSTSTTVVTVHHDGGRERDTQSSPELAAVSRAHSSKSNNSSSTSSSAAAGAAAGDVATCLKSSTEPNTPAKQQQQPTQQPRPPPMSSPPAPIRNPRHQQFLQQEKSKPPVFNEFQAPSIAMSACRSRLRQKLLPPGGSLDLPLAGTPGGPADALQHFSSPNIAGGAIGVGARLLARDCDDADGDSADTESALMAATEEGVAANRSLSYDVLTGVKRPVSADSLAKQSLIAAQLLNLIPAERARERNFMAGRLAVNSLFGPTELDKVLPTREVKIYVCTWNMNGQNPPKTMTDFVLPHSIEFVPDLVVVGTQESCSVRFEWEVSLQETLGPSHILLHSATLGTLHLAVFIRRDLIWFCTVPEDASLSVRPGTAFRTKGAVAISFSLFGTSMLFVTSHLTAHQQKVKERVQDVKRIIHSLDLPRNLNIRNKNKDVTQNFDNVFWCGDLNFRLGEPREKVLKWIENTKFPLPAHLPNGYLHTDQLKSVLSNGAAFKDFKEANITFPPTYKYDPGTQHFDTSSKQRAPAYTDRILYKNKSLPMGIRRGSNLANLLGNASNQLECLAYDSVPSIVTSDHKPVWALFRSPVRPGLDSVPLAAGLFNREVYLEGMKRRLNNTNADSSAVCTIQ